VVLCSCLNSRRQQLHQHDPQLRRHARRGTVYMPFWRFFSGMRANSLASALRLICPLNRGVQRAARRETVSPREIESPAGVHPTVVVQLGWPCVAPCDEQSRVSAIAKARCGPSQNCSGRASHEFCSAAVSMFGPWTFAGSKPAPLRAMRPPGSPREKKAAGTLSSSGFGFSLPWRFTDTVAHTENLFCAHTLRITDKQNRKKINPPRTLIFETLSHTFSLFFSSSCERRNLKLATISGQHSDIWERGD